MKMFTKVTLKGKNKQSQSLIDDTKDYMLVGKSNKVNFDDREGPYLFFEAVKKKGKPKMGTFKDGFWVREQDDKQFTYATIESKK